MDENHRPNHDKEKLRLGRRPGDIDRNQSQPAGTVSIGYSSAEPFVNVSVGTGRPADLDRARQNPQGARFPDNIIPFKKGGDNGNA